MAPSVSYVPSRTTLLFCGLILLTLPTIEFGGYFLIQVAVDSSLASALSPLQQTFFRAGHAHAGVLTILALVVQLLADWTRLPRAWAYVARIGIPLAAFLLPTGFFLAVLTTPDAPGPGIYLVYAGAACLATGALALGVGLIRRWRAARIPPIRST